MWKIALLTLYNNNYWNKLQNYAVQEIIKKYVRNWEITTIRNNGKVTIKILLITWINYLFKEYKNTWIINTILQIIKKSLNILICTIKGNCSKWEKILFQEKQLSNRTNSFNKFNKHIKSSDFIEDVYRPNRKNLEWFDYYIVGSYQVRHPRSIHLMPLFTLWYIKDNNKKIAFSASFAIDHLPKWNSKGIKDISKFKAISVRETKWKEIIEEYTDRKDVQVLLDPTMLLPVESRDKISICPSQFKELWFENNKYIFCYFLWSITEKAKHEIERIAKEQNNKIIYIMDINDPFYTCWPSEFVWLIRNAYLVCTDSFHWSVFSLLYNKPFLVFNRVDPWQKEWEKNSMNSRLVTLLEKFQIKNRYFNWKIDNKLLMPDYPQFKNILNQEKIKADKFLKQAFDE